MTRRVELLAGCAAFAALGGALCWLAVEWWREGTMRWTPLGGTVTGPLAGAVAAGYAALGVGTILAALLFLRARWTPPLPGDPVQPSPDRR